MKAGPLDTKRPSLQPGSLSSRQAYAFLFSQDRRRLVPILRNQSVTPKGAPKKPMARARRPLTPATKATLQVRLKKAKSAGLFKPSDFFRRKPVLSSLLSLWESFGGCSTPQSIDIFFRAVDIFDKWAQVGGRWSQEKPEVIAHFSLILAAKVSSPQKPCCLRERVPTPAGYTLFESQFLPKINFDVFDPTLKDCLEIWLALATEEQLLPLCPQTYERLIWGGWVAVLDDQLCKWERNRLSGSLLLWAVGQEDSRRENWNPASEGLTKFVARTHARLHPKCQSWDSEAWCRAATEVGRLVGPSLPTARLSAVSWDFFKQNLGYSTTCND